MLLLTYVTYIMCFTCGQDKASSLDGTQGTGLDTHVQPTPKTTEAASLNRMPRQLNCYGFPCSIKLEFTRVCICIFTSLQQHIHTITIIVRLPYKRCEKKSKSSKSYLGIQL